MREAPHPPAPHPVPFSAAQYPESLSLCSRWPQRVSFCRPVPRPRVSTAPQGRWGSEGSSPPGLLGRPPRPHPCWATTQLWGAALALSAAWRWPLEGDGEGAFSRATLRVGQGPQLGGHSAHPGKLPLGRAVRIAHLLDRSLQAARSLPRSGPSRPMG